MDTASFRFLTAEWRWLAMLNYEIDPKVLLPFVPRGTELDCWNGKTFVSVVGFLFLRTRLLGRTIPFHSDFEEINLRFYVRRLTTDGPRRAVVFIKEIVPHRFIAWTARAFYNENYVAAPMRHEVRLDDSGSPQKVAYEWKANGRANRISVHVSGSPAAVASGSSEEFITEHYWGYVRQRNGGTVEYQVEHPSWRVWPVEEAELDCDVGRFYGPALTPFLCQKPAFAFLAEGSEVTVFRGKRLLL